MPVFIFTFVSNSTSINAHSCTLTLLMSVLLTRVTHSSQEHVVRELDVGYGSGLSSLSIVAEFANEVCTGVSVSRSISARQLATMPSVPTSSPPH